MEEIENLVKQKAQELYLEVCKEIIETNGLKEKAIELSLKICDMHIESETGKDPLFSDELLWKKIKLAFTGLPAMGRPNVPRHTLLPQTD